MLNKTYLLFLTVITALSGTAYAASDDMEQNSGLYLGADLGNTRVELASGGTSVKELGDASNLTYDLVLGYEFDTHRQIKLGAEVEYRRYGDMSIDGLLDIEGSATFVNIKPKFIAEYAAVDFYLAPMVGLGQMDLDFAVPNLNASASESEMAYQLGIEYGIRFYNDLDLNFGYRNAMVTIDDVDITIDGFYAGIRYNF